ncbi:hypothetical protein Btru_043721 [Bulinus truncatus]|nr:hypothetical protein Btru_043721 [Bulinus truncatus]
MERHHCKTTEFVPTNRCKTTEFDPTNNLTTIFLHYHQLSSTLTILSSTTHQLSSTTHQLSYPTHQFPQWFTSSGDRSSGLHLQETGPVVYIFRRMPSGLHLQETGSVVPTFFRGSDCQVLSGRQVSGVTTTGDKSSGYILGDRSKNVNDELSKTTGITVEASGIGKDLDSLLQGQDICPLASISATANSLRCHGNVFGQLAFLGGNVEICRSIRFRARRSPSWLPINIKKRKLRKNKKNGVCLALASAVVKVGTPSATSILIQVVE